MNQLVIAVAIIMFPGIISAVICDKVIVHNPQWTQFKFSLYSFVLGTMCYLSLQMITFGKDILCAFFFGDIKSGVNWSVLKIWSVVSDGNIQHSPVEVLKATLLSLPVAYVSSLIVNYKLFNKIANKLSVSNKYGDENLFSFFLNAKEINWVYVRDIRNNLTYQGRVYLYSENNNIQEIVLSDVTVYSYQDSEEYYSVPSIYLCQTIGNFIIESVSEELLES